MRTSRETNAVIYIADILTRRSIFWVGPQLILRVLDWVIVAMFRRTQVPRPVKFLSRLFERCLGVLVFPILVFLKLLYVVFHSVELDFVYGHLARQKWLNKYSKLLLKYGVTDEDLDTGTWRVK